MKKGCHTMKKATARTKEAFGITETDGNRVCFYRCVVVALVCIYQPVVAVADTKADCLYEQLFLSSVDEARTECKASIEEYGEFISEMRHIDPAYAEFDTYDLDPRNFD